MPQEVLRQVNFTGGELDPALLGRRDFKGYFSGLAKGENLIFQAQGGLLRRPGLAIIDYISGPYSAIGLGGLAYTAPNGGTAAQGVDPTDGLNLATTTAMGTHDPYVVLTIDLGAVKTVSAVDLIDYAAVPGGGGATPEPIPVDYRWYFGQGAATGYYYP